MLNVARHRILGLLAAVMLLAGCQYDSIVNQVREETRRNDSLAISFGNGVIDNPVKTRALSLLSQHTNTMGVWGWQTTTDQMEVQLFNNHLVSFDQDANDWTYTPARYWEKGSSYRFYAYAPNSTTVPGTSVSINKGTGRIIINNVVLEGNNTMSAAPRPQPYGTFSSVTDVDWLVDREGKTVNPEQTGSQVTFNMQHILAKLIVMVTPSNTINESGVTVILDSLSIGQFYSKADFTQILDHSPVIGIESDESAQEWQIDTTCTTYALHSVYGAEIDSAGCCVIESLILPHQADSTQNILIHYSLHYQDGRVQHFDSRLALQDAFSVFNSANSYTLHLIVGPQVITFNAGATLWDKEEWSGWWKIAEGTLINVINKN